MRYHVIVCATALALAGCGDAESSAEDDPTAVTSEELQSAGYRAKVTTNPSPVIVGAPASLDIRMSGPHAAPITQFDLLHTQKLHLIAVSSDLEDFIHVHPALQPAGDLTSGAKFSRSQPYALFMEYDPAGSAGPSMSRARVAPAGSHVVRAQL